MLSKIGCSEEDLRMVEPRPAAGCLLCGLGWGGVGLLAVELADSIFSEDIGLILI